jgi:hypothetical protein
VRLAAAFGRFWWEFLVGDDWRIAAGVATVLTAGALLVTSTELGDGAIALVSGGAIMAFVTVTIARTSRRRRRATGGCS